MDERIGIKSERDHSSSAQGVMEKQHLRLRTICEAFMQAIGWMREIDLTDDEKCVREAAFHLIEDERAKRIAG